VIDTHTQSDVFTCLTKDVKVLGVFDTVITRKYASLPSRKMHHLDVNNPTYMKEHERSLRSRKYAERWANGIIVIVR
jgi:hypothetical protein